MREQDVIQHTPNMPATVPSLVTDLKALGVKPGMVLLVHSSLSALGWVSGGAVAVILALEEALGPAGALVMPAHSGDLSDPASWEEPPVPQRWWALIRQTMPAYAPDLTPTRLMGAIPETFRKQQGVRRSAHPHFSFAAWGAKAADIIEGHSLDDGLGEESPLARIYDLDGWVLLLGVDHSRNTSLHLAEYRANFPAKPPELSGAPIIRDGQRRWVTLRDIELDSSDFAALGKTLVEETTFVRSGRVAQAPTQLIPQRLLVDYAVTWLEKNRYSKPST